MMDPELLAAEREYADKVRGHIARIIEYSSHLSRQRVGEMKEIISDAWDELRKKATALSPEELDQLSQDMDRLLLRKKFEDEIVTRYGNMLSQPYFARIDFREEGEEETETVRLGIHTVDDENNTILVCDWRAPVGSLYYEGQPGKTKYSCPNGDIPCELQLKRQYSFADGKLEYYVDTLFSIDDRMLLDVLSRDTTEHMKQIVSTIQGDQNRVIRHSGDRFMAVVGCAGSGKTSVALHRAAYLIYSTRGKWDATRIEILSPSTAFSEYISNVLPELGEKNIRAMTMYELVTRTLGRAPESPEEQQRLLLRYHNETRIASLAKKGSMDFLRAVERFLQKFRTEGPRFSDIPVEDRFVITSDKIRNMYRKELSYFTVSQRMERVRKSLISTLKDFEMDVRRVYEERYAANYQGRALDNAVNLAVQDRFRPILRQIEEETTISPLRMLEGLYRETLGEETARIYRQNLDNGMLWWEDAVTAALIALSTGCAKGDDSVCHLLVDEAQDHTPVSLRVLHAYHPGATVTCLGDPMQRTTPGLEECDPEVWQDCFETKGELFRLNHCYRSTKQIARFCGRIMPEACLTPVGRDGEEVVTAELDDQSIDRYVREFRAKYHSVAVVTRTQRKADKLAENLPDVYRLDGGYNDAEYRAGDTVVACCHNVKGMEFDAVIVVWDGGDETHEDRRRLYTACTRALHQLVLCADNEFLKKVMK